MQKRDLEKEMRVYETADDYCILPKMYTVVRLDGKNFSKLTKTYYKKPFDEYFKDIMVDTTIALMKDSGFSIDYAYCQSDEISLLINRYDKTFNLKTRKIISIFAGLASATFSLKHGNPAVFDARISQLPNELLLYDYFKWRQEDSINNCLNGYCYWTLRENGRKAKQAQSELLTLNTRQKEDLLFDLKVNYNRVPLWEKRGFSVFWETYEKEGFNPKTNQTIKTERRKISVDYNIPTGYDYEDYMFHKIYSVIERE